MTTRPWKYVGVFAALVLTLVPAPFAAAQSQPAISAAAQRSPANVLEEGTPAVVNIAVNGGERWDAINFGTLLRG